MISPDELEAWAKLYDRGYYSFEPDEQMFALPLAQAKVKLGFSSAHLILFTSAASSLGRGFQRLSP